MNLYTKCSKCNAEIRFRLWVSDRVEYKMNKGKAVSLTCKKCFQKDNYSIDDVKAIESKLVQIVALTVLVLGTALAFMLLHEYILSSLNIYAIAIPLGLLLIPSFFYGILLKSSRQKVSNFNNS